jgi:dolichol-phosphate mannosyltransferase
MKRVVVTGGTGFVGANLVRRLVADGYETHLLVRRGHDSWRIDSIRQQLRLHDVNLSDRTSLTATLATIAPGWIFHLAAHGAYSWQTDAELMTETNVVGTANLLAAALDAGFDAFINVGSSSEYGPQDHAPAEVEPGDPDTPYAITKAAATALCVKAARAHAARICTLRLYSAYGPYEDPRRFLPSLIVHGSRGVFPPLVDARTARDFVYVDDVVQAFFIVARHPAVAPGAIYNVGTGVQTTIGDAVDVARRVLGVPGAPQWGSMPGRVWDTTTWIANSRKIRDELGWAPQHSFEGGFQRMVAWLNQHPDVRDRYDAAWR